MWQFHRRHKKMSKPSGNLSGHIGATFRKMICRPIPAYGTRTFWAGRRSVPHVRKDHITHWITSQTSKGLAFKTGEFKPAAIQVTEDVAVACYWITCKWLVKDGNGAANSIRIAPVWHRTENDWSIRGGMCMPDPVTQPKEWRNEKVRT